MHVCVDTNCWFSIIIFDGKGYILSILNFTSPVHNNVSNFFCHHSTFKTCTDTLEMSWMGFKQLYQLNNSLGEILQNNVGIFIM